MIDFYNVGGMFVFFYELKFLLYFDVMIIIGCILGEELVFIFFCLLFLDLLFSFIIYYFNKFLYFFSFFVIFFKGNFVFVGGVVIKVFVFKDCSFFFYIGFVVVFFGL